MERGFYSVSLIYCFLLVLINPPSTIRIARTIPAIGAPVFCIPTVLACTVSDDPPVPDDPPSLARTLTGNTYMLLSMFGSKVSVVSVGWKIKLPWFSALTCTHA